MIAFLLFLLFGQIFGGCSGCGQMHLEGREDGEQDYLEVKSDEITKEPASEPVDFVEHTGDVLIDAVGDSPELCSVQYYWELQPRMINSVNLFGGGERFGATQRLWVTVQLHSSCERLAKIDMEQETSSDGAADFIKLSAYAWVPVGMSCLPAVTMVSRVILLEGRGNQGSHVVVIDENSSGGGLRLEYDRQPCSGDPDCQCSWSTPPGDASEGERCITDCSCQEGLGCIGYVGITGDVHYGCFRPCNDFLDCQQGETCRSYGDGPSFICGVGDACYGDEDCPDGFRCAQADMWNQCIDERQLPVMKECQCDEQCSAGQICAKTFRDRAYCEVPCEGSEHCPMAEYDLFVCGAQAICLPLE